jgi:hypothetical protein
MAGVRQRFSIPLPLAPVAGTSSPKTPLSGSSSTGSSGGGRHMVTDTPRCPTCANDSAARKFRFWLAGGAWVWLCSAEPTGRDGHGQAHCGRLFVEAPDDRHARHCPACGGTDRDFEVRRKSVGLWCPQCDTFQTT